jgi:glycosyltransferase involved in cell wall biosynthesis
MSSKREARPPLRVALDTSYAGINPTGVGLYSARLARELRRLAGECALDIYCFGPACKRDGAPNKLLGTFQEWPSYTHGVLPAQLLALRPRVVHSTSHMGPLWGPGELIVTVHDLIFMRYPEDYQAGWLAITKALLASVLRRARAIIADSQATKDDLRAFFGVRHGKIVVIYPGIDGAIDDGRPTIDDRRSTIDDRRPTTDDRPAITGGRPYVLCLGPWVRRKNLEVVVQAFAWLAERVPGVDLVITGDTPRGMKGYTRQELLSYVSDEYRRRVKLVGYVSSEEKQALVGGASVLCYPSRFEGFGLPPLEAMAAGVPVVAADTPAVVEVTGGAALISDPDEPREWSAAIESVLLDPGLARRLREAGLRRSADFTWAACARRTALLYRSVAGLTEPRRSI